MRVRDAKLWIGPLIFFGIAFPVFSQGPAHKVAKSDILLHIVSQCVDPLKNNYCDNCMLPRADANCGDGSECKKTNEVWALNPQFVAMRDIKMCGCPVDFVHGLAMPRAVVTGIEDPNRAEGIWKFAWDEGLSRIDSESLALVVNPKSERSQNQLHIHMVRLDENTRTSFVAYSHAYVSNLSNVWHIAEQLAAIQSLSDYGILVTKEHAGTYVVLVSEHSPEAAFTIWNCGN